jgi:hypothetical protein
MVLTDRERLTFLNYCRRQADSGKAMAEQMAKLPGSGMSELANREKMKAAAYAIVAQDLAAMTTIETVGPEDVGELPAEEGE